MLRLRYSVWGIRSEAIRSSVAIRSSKAIRLACSV